MTTYQAIMELVLSVPSKSLNYQFLSVSLTPRSPWSRQRCDICTDHCGRTIVGYTVVYNILTVLF